MASEQYLAKACEGRKQNLRQMGWQPARAPQQQYTTSKGVTDYNSKNLPIPPRPSSSCSSIYDDETGGGEIRHQPLQRQHLSADYRPESRDSMSGFAGAIDEDALAKVRPPNLNTKLSQSYYKAQDIASPQPKRPDHKLLRLKTGADEVSPIMTPGTGTQSWMHHNVSPLSSPGSAYTSEVESAEPDRNSFIGFQDSWSQDGSSQAGQQYSTKFNNSSTPQPSKSVQTATVHPQIQRINSRYSDPGSPSGAGIDSRAWGDPGPDVGRSKYLGTTTGAQQQQAGGQAASTKTYKAYHPQRSNTPGEAAASRSISATSVPKVSFAVPKIDGYSSRSRSYNQNAGKHRPAPAPLRLSDRPLAEEHIKTPFPSHLESPDSSQKSVFESDDDDDDDGSDDSDDSDDDKNGKHGGTTGKSKRSPRVSSFGSFVGRGAKPFRPSSSHGGSGAGGGSREEGGGGAFLVGTSSRAETPEARHRQFDLPVRASPKPTMKNIFSKAKQGLGMGGGASSEEARKEKRREEIKRQIRFGGSTD